MCNIWIINWEELNEAEDGKKGKNKFRSALELKANDYYNRLLDETTQMEAEQWLQKARDAIQNATDDVELVINDLFSGIDFSDLWDSYNEDDEAALLLTVQSLIEDLENAASVTLEYSIEPMEFRNYYAGILIEPDNENVDYDTLVTALLGVSATYPDFVFMVIDTTNDDMNYNCADDYQDEDNKCFIQAGDYTSCIFGDKGIMHIGTL